MDTYNSNGIPYISRDIIEHLEKRYSTGVMLSSASYNQGYKSDTQPSESYKLGYISGMNHIITYLKTLCIEQEEEAYDALKGGE